MTLQGLADLERQAQHVQVKLVYEAPFDTGWEVKEAYDIIEDKILNQAVAQIKAHREEKFKTALARYVAGQGDNHETD